MLLILYFFILNVTFYKNSIILIFEYEKRKLFGNNFPFLYENIIELFRLDRKLFKQIGYPFRVSILSLFCIIFATITPCQSITSPVLSTISTFTVPFSIFVHYHFFAFPMVISLSHITHSSITEIRLSCLVLILSYNPKVYH